MTNKIILVAESGADIPEEYKKQYGIQIVPMYVEMNGKSFPDCSFPVREIYKYYEETGKSPKTSAPNSEDYRMVFTEIHQEFPEASILHLGYSAVTSCSYQNSLIASEEMDFVYHIDSKAVSAGQGALLIRTARFIEKNSHMPIEVIMEHIQEWINCQCMCFLPNTVEYLKAGGRVSNAAYLGATLLSIKPLIEIIDGKLVSTRKYRGNAGKTIPRMIDDFFKNNNPERQEIYVLWAEGFDHSQDEMIEKQLKGYGVDQIIWGQTGTVITTHGGPGVFGLAGYKRF